jgi:hypothetical protein
VLETDNGTPYFLNLHNGEVAHTLILGMTGSGKAFGCDADQVFTAVTSPGLIARLVRLDIVPIFMPALFKFRAVRRYMFRTVSQTAVNYRGSSLSEGRAGTIHGGDRAMGEDRLERYRDRQLRTTNFA